MAETTTSAPDLDDGTLDAARQQAMQLAEVLTSAYLDFKAAAPELDIGQLKVSGQRGYLKLIGIDPEEIDQELDYELLEREDFLWSTREDWDREQGLPPQKPAL